MSHLGHGNPSFGQRWISISLAALLTFPSGIALAGPADASAVPSVGALAVDSDPPGATVYVDGRFAGQTPVSVSRLPAGDHRVRVLKDGYLENGRIVSVNPKQANTVQVKLTRNTTNTEMASQVTGGGGGGGGGSKKWIWIGAAAGGGVAAILLVKGRNKPPVVTVSANTTQGLAASTAISFTAQASDPDGDSLTYTWDFGDGSTGSNSASQTHTYNSAGTFNAKVSVSDGKASTDASTSVTIRSMAGAWSGSFVGFNFTMNLAQNGATITGNYSDRDGPGTVVAGSAVAAGNSVRIVVNQPPFVPFTFSGTADAAVSTVTGTVADQFGTFGSFTMRR